MRNINKILVAGLILAVLIIGTVASVNADKNVNDVTQKNQVDKIVIELPKEIQEQNSELFNKLSDELTNSTTKTTNLSEQSISSSFSNTNYRYMTITGINNYISYGYPASEKAYQYFQQPIIVEIWKNDLSPNPYEYINVEVWKYEPKDNSLKVIYKITKQTDSSGKAKFGMSDFNSKISGSASDYYWINIWAWDNAGTLYQIEPITVRWWAYKLNPGEYLKPGESITSDNGWYRLKLRTDGNLVLYRTKDGVALWSTGTGGLQVSKAVMQTDGNFVLYDAYNRSLWNSGTNGHPGSWLNVQDDANLVIYEPIPNDKPIWAR